MLAEPTGAWVFSDRQSTLHGDVPFNASALRHRPFRDFAAVVEGDEALWLGSLGYDLNRHIERLPTSATRDRRWPDATMLRCPGWLLHDAQTGQWSAHGAWASADHATTPPPESSRATPATKTPPRSAPPQRHGLPQLDTAAPHPLKFTAGSPLPNVTRAQHEAAVRRALDYIAAGDIFQVNLTQRFTAPFAGNPRGLFAALTQRSPAWYGAYLECPWPHAPAEVSEIPERLRSSEAPDARASTAAPRWPAIVSTSPELFFELGRDRRVTARPIKGTRPADTPPQVLHDSEKDTAELTMIVDLLRNDLGRVCSYGSIAVPQPRSIERHPTVQHGVATVTGTLHPRRGFADLLRAVFPCGSITGAPKVRAMQIIEQLEPVRRGPYCGAVGGVFPGGEPEPDAGDVPTTAAALPQAVFNVAIRTMLVDQGRVDFAVGGGIVADSTPAGEYQETLDKARAMLDALRAGYSPQRPPTQGPAQAGLSRLTSDTLSP